MKLSDLARNERPVRFRDARAKYSSIKNTRDAFLYFNHNPRSPKGKFAQCSTCRMFVPDEYMPESKGKDFDLCIVHGSDVKVGEDWSCGVYCVWPKGKPNPDVIRDHAAELAQGIPGSVTPEQSGLVERQVRCENCTFHLPDTGQCDFYIKLQAAQPELWDLDPNVDPHGCCNANIEKRA